MLATESDALAPVSQFHITIKQAAAIDPTTVRAVTGIKRKGLLTTGKSDSESMIKPIAVQPNHTDGSVGILAV
jgi:hypothetical protein